MFAKNLFQGHHHLSGATPRRKQGFKVAEHVSVHDENSGFAALLQRYLAAIILASRSICCLCDRLMQRACRSICCACSILDQRASHLAEMGVDHGSNDIARIELCDVSLDLCWTCAMSDMLLCA